MTISSETVPIFASLKNEQYINLVTYRRSGIPVSTPIWFALDVDKIVCYTSPSSGKVKRLHHTSRVTLNTCTASGSPKGAEIAGEGYIITDKADAQRARDLLRRKYNIQWGAIHFIVGIRTLFKQSKRAEAFITITPMRPTHEATTIPEQNKQ
jgi:PPOX class probable F420-dependent enzyme